MFEGFTIAEVDIQEQIANINLAYKGVINFRFVPLIELQKLIEMHLKTKK